MSALSPERIRERLQTRVVGARILCVDSCESTNDLAWKEALGGAPDGSVVFAEEQTRGRGRFGRTWTAPRGKALLLSAVLRPRLGTERIPLLTAMGALAAADVAGPASRIRFPNDVMLEERKIAGVLVEARFMAGRPEVFVLGLGFNVNAHPEGVQAASLGPDVPRLSVARSLLEALDRWYGLLEGDLEDYRRAWRERSFILARRVRVKIDGAVLEGVVEEVDPLDGIVLRADSGRPRALRSEHVEHLQVL
jgi:BirA family biotin operon repressor/biotin-[acetyl-CoA-carboxylase] ligase